MYIGFLLFMFSLFLYYELIFKLSSNQKRTNSLLILTLFFSFFFIVSFSIVFVLIFDDPILDGFKIISPDSLRYIFEAKVFAIEPFMVNELAGEFYSYKVTPKMGISSLIAWLSQIFYFNDDLSFYLIYNSFVALIFCVAISIFFTLAYELNLNEKFILISVVFFFFLPTDLYWLSRLLRESLANVILTILLTLHILYSLRPKRKYLTYYFFFSFALLFFRAQLLLLMCVFSFIYALLVLRLNKLTIVSVSFFIISLLQSIETMGYSKVKNLFGLFESDFINSALPLILKLNSSSVIPISFFIFFILLINKDRGLFSFSSYVKSCFILSFLGVFFYFSLDYMQIRFVYPYIIFFKFLVFLFLIDLARQNKIKNFW